MLCAHITYVRNERDKRPKRFTAMLNTHRYENKMLEIINLACSALSIECCIFQESYLFRFYI